ncbi:MAG: daunorubicin resistance protein DrrA family transporter ATP-binding protein, partial [Acidimicrobiia bacterium]|nr:daunorubicin resistance protein DrrA family transporter ATP-binding protein [Acidimicrobiia bacterium]
MPVVEAIGLTKRFGPTDALRGLDLVIERGTVLGMLGPNGAGKTTAVRILTTLLKADSGRAFVDGIDVAAEPRKVRARIGLTGQYAAVEDRLTGRENLELVGRFYRMASGQARHRATELLGTFGLEDAADRTVKGYSGGMRRRLDIAMSLVARPRVLFLDEPTTGLDPRSRLGMWDLIEALVAEGTTTLLTTQYLEEADRLAHHIVVVDHGTVIARGTSEELKTTLGGDRVLITLTSAHDRDAARAAVDSFALAGSPAVLDDPLLLSIAVRAGTSTPAIVHALDAVGLAVSDVAIERPTLDDVFLSLTGHAAIDDGSM